MVKFGHLIMLISIAMVTANPDAKRLYDDLMSSYNSLIRPVANNSDRLTIKMGLRLSQLIDVNLKNQVMSTNMWVEQEWTDYKLRWDPEEYGGVSTLYVPSEQIWLPDLVLYNNADGNYEVTIMTKAVLHHDGKVIWNPPAIYKSACLIDIQYFPFDKQECKMKFGSWTYDGNQVDLRHNKEINGSNIVPLGIDLEGYYLSVEWDILSVPAIRNEIFYACCPDDPYIDITFNITLRRKTLFYTVNLIIPCVGISSLSFLVFYLPSDSGEKVALTISILLSLTFFFLVLMETIPSSSLAIPILGQYLVFTLIMISLSILATIVVLNIHFRSPSSHKMKPWVRRLFIRTLPKLLLMRSPQYKLDLSDPKPENGKEIGEGNGSNNGANSRNGRRFTASDLINPPTTASGGDAEELIQELDSSPDGSDPLGLEAISGYPREVDKAIKDAMFIAQHIDNKDEYQSIHEDWKYVAMVLDRLFLWIFATASILGTAAIFLQAPSLYDFSQPIDVVYSKITHQQFDALAEVPFPEAVSML